MNLFSIEENHSWRNFFTRLTLIIATVTTIVWFLPRENKFGYQFDLGKPWKYGSLIAKFDFPVYKSDKTIQKEKDSLVRQYEPYYTYDKNVEQQAISKLRTDLGQHKEEIPQEYVNRIADVLHRIYQQG